MRLNRNSVSGFSYRASHSNLFFVRTPRFFNRSRRRNLSVKNIARELKDPPVNGEASLDTFEPDSASIAPSIEYQAEFTLHSLQSVRNSLIINRNPTYEYYEKMNVKQAYYLSMEYLKGRALLSVIGNLEISGAYADALRKLGHKLEDVAGHMGNPWEIVRNDASYLVKFHGEVVSKLDGSKEWVRGENIIDVAYDVPISGHNTKTTTNLVYGPLKLHRTNLI